MNLTPRHGYALILALAGITAPAFGQTAASATPAPAAGPTPSAQQDQVVQLQAFDVTANSDVNGYVASESTTGTRVATKIADLPFVVNVVTSDFLNDFDFFNIGNDLGYTSSLSQVDEEGNYNLRGFPGTFNLWNGFYNLGLVDRTDIDRIEIIKGPNAAIYGQTSPAGIVNIITKRPTPNPYEDLDLTYGSFGTERLEGAVDTPLGSIGGVQLSNLVTFEGMDNQLGTPEAYTYGGYAYQHQRSDSEALTAKFNDHSSLYFTVDWYKDLSNTGDGEQMFDYNSKTKAYTGALAPLNLARFSQGGPNERQNREITRFYTEYENRLSDVWSLRVEAEGYDRHNSEIYNGTSTEFDPSLGEVVGISTKPDRTILNEDGGGSHFDLLGHWSLFNGLVENNALATLDYEQDWRFRAQLSLPSTLSKGLPTEQNPEDPDYNGVPDYPAWTVVTRNDKVRWDTEGAFFHDQVIVDKRLILYAGIRHDQVTYNLDFGNQYSTTAPYPIASPGQVQHFVNAAWTPAAGANYKLNASGTVALYGNYSQSFQASAQDAKLGDQELPNTRGNGVDYGVKCDFLNDRLVFTLGGFYVTETGIKINITLPDGDTEPVAGGSQNSRGVETDFTYAVTPSLFLGGGFGWVNAQLLNEGTDTLADGRPPPMNPIDNGGLYLKYDLSKLGVPGLAFHAGAVYDGASYPETTASTAVEAGIKIPSYYTATVGVDYSWTNEIRGFKLLQTVGLEVDNALNRDYVDVALQPDAPRGFYFSYRLSH